MAQLNAGAERAVLLVDDEPAWLRACALTLRAAGVPRVETCQQPEGVLAKVRQDAPALILLDLTMPRLDGETLLTQLQQDHPAIPVIILSARTELETAVRCMRLGAFDYVVKGAEEERLVTAVRRALEAQSLREENRSLPAALLANRLKHPEIFATFLTASPVVMGLFRYLELVASSAQPLLITGETGTGKELLAQAAHRLSGRKGRMVAVNAAGLDDSLFTDSLFGHIKGAFSGAIEARGGLVEHAAGGTLFLDEIGDLTLASQVKLLRLIQEGEFLPVGSDVPSRSSARLVFATHAPLERMAEDGRFRRDLLYRLSAHHLHIPPLRERPEDIRLLFNHFLTQQCFRQRIPVPYCPEKVINLIQTLRLSGNVRQLETLCRELAIGQPGPVLTVQAIQKHRFLCDLPPSTPETTLWPQGASGAHSLLSPSPDAPTERARREGRVVFPRKLPTLEEAGRQLVEEALGRTGGNLTHAAALLGISRQALSKRLKGQQPVATAEPESED